MRAALRSVVLAVVTITGVSLYAFWVAFRWLWRHDEELRQIRREMIPTEHYERAGDLLPAHWRR